MNQFRLITDPGHGWLEVPISLLKELGIACKISSFSYVRRDMAYLEEDRDMGLFLDAMKRAGRDVEYIELYQENTPIRGYSSYPAHPCLQEVV